MKQAKNGSQQDGIYQIQLSTVKSRMSYPPQSVQSRFSGLEFVAGI